MEGTELRHVDVRDFLNADPEAAARTARLTYVNDEEPGLGRRRRGSGFQYLDKTGNTLADKEALRRIKALAIPPAWTEVWISPAANGHIQATGRDQKGRKQYLYHADWSAFRDEQKFSGLAEFARALPNLRKKVDTDLRKRSLTRDRVSASLVWLLDNTMIRIGNDAYVRHNGSYGLTTLRSRHAVIDGSRLHFTFVGKSGQKWDTTLADRRVISVIRSLQELPGQRLFQYLDDEGRRLDIRSQDINDYIRAEIGDDFSSKYFRTWGGTTEAAYLLTHTPLPESKRARAVAVNGVIDQVARHLNNTRAVCRRCYIHPVVIDAWSEGTLSQSLKEVRLRNPRPVKGLDVDEATVLRWLEEI